MTGAPENFLVDVLLSTATFLLLISMGAGFWRIAVGPMIGDRLVGLQMTGTAAIALLLLLAYWLEQPGLRDVAVVLALLAAGITAAMVQILRRPPADAREDKL